MRYQGYDDGLYLVARRAPEKGVDHYGILDIGNRFGLPEADGVNPVIVHQRPPSIAVEWLKDTGTTPWRLLGRVTDETHARRRLRQAAANPAYNLFGHNCEHFARFIATGKPASSQLRTVGFVAGLAVLTFVAFNG